MAAVNMLIIDALNSLLEAEWDSLFRFVGQSAPYLTRATVVLRQQLDRMAAANEQNAQALFQMVESLGGEPAGRSLEPREQYLAYLSLPFLLTKLIDAQLLLIRRYENARRALGKSAPPQVLTLLEAHLAAHREELAVLKSHEQGAKVEQRPEKGG